MNYDDLNNVFLHHSFFYTVSGLSMNEAIERCARLSSNPVHVTTINGGIVLASMTDLGSEIPWLIPVAGNPSADEPAPE
jgi:hypothetical protein